MLTLKDPIQLHITQGLTGNAEAFGARIMGNYSILGARYTPKDLLFLLAAPPELPESQPGMTTLVEQSTSIDARKISLDVVNHVVNRILLDGTSQFTYQDQVYITTVLNRLGITDVEQFMQQVRQLRIENESTIHMTRLYRQELRRLLEMRRAGEHVPPLPLPERSEQGEEAPVPEPGTELSMNILRRLDTANLYQKIHAFQHSFSAVENQFHHNELRLSEHLRFGNTVELAQLKQTIYQQPRMLLRQHISQYETGELMEPPRDEEQVLSQAAVSALVSAVDNTVVEVLNRPQFRREQWLHLEQAIWQTAEKALMRFETYHTDYNPPAQPQKAAAQTAWNQYTQEIQEYHQLYQVTHPGESPGELERIFSLSAPPAMLHPRQEEAEEEQIFGQTSIWREREPGERVIRERSERARLEKMWSEHSSVRELIFRQERRLAAYERLRTRQLEEKLELRERETPSGAVPPLLPPSAEDRVPSPSYPPVPMTLRQAEEQAPQVLAEQLQRIDQQNRTVWQTIQAAARPAQVGGARGPDVKRTLRDGLRALETPELVLRELAQRQSQPAPRMELTPQEQALLKQADPASRALYERVLTYHKNPQLALEQGLIKPAGMQVLQAALKGAETETPMEHLEPQQREIRQVREESERILEQMIHLKQGRERVSSPPPKTPDAVKLIHKQAATEMTEELLEQLQTQRTQSTVKTENRDEITRQNISQTDVKQVENKVIRQTTEDISELINRTLARQMKNISDQVYRQMERRLQTERSRRGRL